MNTIYKDIQTSISIQKRLLAILIDPDKFSIEKTRGFLMKINKSPATHIFVGGSTVDENLTEVLVVEIKKYTHLPIVIFPGDSSQITDKADALLFLSLISGRNPEYLIGKQINAVSKLRNMSLEVIPTGYILIESGKKTAVERVTNTLPLPRNNVQYILDTARAGEFLGKKLIYLEAGSGAEYPISDEIIHKVKSELNLPLIVGGGIKSKIELEQAYTSGADMVVIGTAFEQDESFIYEL